MKSLFITLTLLLSLNAFSYEDVNFVSKYPTLQTALDNVQSTYDVDCKLKSKGFAWCLGGSTLGGNTSMGHAFSGVCTRVRKYTCGKNIKVKARFRESTAFDSQNGHYIKRKLKSVKVKIRD